MFYLLLMQWIPFWGSDWTLSMGIFISEGGGNWGWRETVGRTDKHHQYSSVGFLARMENTCIHSVQITILFTSRQMVGTANTLGPTGDTGKDTTLAGMLLIRTVSTVMISVIWE